MIPKIPLASWIESIVDWMSSSLSGLFNVISVVIQAVVGFFSGLFMLPHPLLFIAILGVLAFLVGRLPLTLFTVIGFLLVDNLGYWSQSMDTLGLVITSGLISILIGVPVGIWLAYSKTAARIITPLLDFMQTMPAFVYLLPAVTFFSLGVVPGVIASVIFAIPPTIRLTHLGIRQVSGELVEAADAFGSTSMQKLFKVQLPLALPTVMSGINQTIMLSLSMVVIASMIGAQGIGAEVYRAVTQLQIGKGFEAVLPLLYSRLYWTVLHKICLCQVAKRPHALQQSKKHGSRLRQHSLCLSLVSHNTSLVAQLPLVATIQQPTL